MRKKKKGKAQKYAKISSDENGNGKNKKASAKKGEPRRSKRRRRPVENSSSFDDYKFRQEVEDGSSRTIINIEADGNCLFGSLSDQLYHDFGAMHAEVRHEVCDYIDAMKLDFQYFLLAEDDESEDVADFDTYVHNMREDGEWGGNAELVAAARLYRRNIVLFRSGFATMIEHGQSESGGPDMMISYHGEEHYNSVRDDTAGMPPPPSKTSFEKRTAVIESSNERETILDKMDIDDEETTTTTNDAALDPLQSEPMSVETTEKDDIKKTENNEDEEMNDGDKAPKEKKQYTDWPLTDIKEPHEHDVLHGRGSGPNQHPGNRRYRKMVQERKAEYENRTNKEKQRIGIEIVRQWRNQVPPGRFLKVDDQSGLWQDVGDKKAREKVSQALRQKGTQSPKQQQDGQNASGSDAVCREASEKQPTAPLAKPPKRNDPCSCGSGLRYKKCCLEANKSKERARKWKAKQHGSSISNDDSGNDESEEKMDGTSFRVLKI